MLRAHWLPPPPPLHRALLHDAEHIHSRDKQPNHHVYDVEYVQLKWRQFACRIDTAVSASASAGAGATAARAAAGMAPDVLLDTTLSVAVHSAAAAAAASSSASPPPSATPLNVTLAQSPTDSALTLTVFDLSSQLLLLHHTQTPASYPAFRHAQSLRIPFSALPDHLVDLLCRPQSNPSYLASLHLRLPPTHPSPEFHTPPETPHPAPVHHDASTPAHASFRVVEMSPFKAITHIDIPMQHASHAQLIATLADLARAGAASAARERSLKQSLQSNQTDLQTLNARVKQLETDLSTAQRHLQRASDKQANCEQLRQQVAQRDDQLAQLPAQQQQIQQLTAQRDHLRSQLSALEQSVQTQQSHTEKLEQQVEKVTQQRNEACSEIEKGNQIIDRLQTEVRTLRSKSRIKSALIRKQELVVQQRDASLSELQREVVRVRDRAALLQVQKEGVDSRLNAALTKLEENRAVLQSDQQVIAYLNRELNERVMGDVGAGAGAGAARDSGAAVEGTDAAATPGVVI